jgi:hypothetical protein
MTPCEHKWETIESSVEVTEIPVTDRIIKEEEVAISFQCCERCGATRMFAEEGPEVN